MTTPNQSTDDDATMPGTQPMGRAQDTEFRVFGQEMIEKEVKTSGKTGRVYLPGSWVGKQVKIIRLD
jgi:hypothetical protein